MPNKPPAKRKVGKKKQTPEEIAEERIAKWKPEKHYPDTHRQIGDDDGAVLVRANVLDLNALGLRVVPESLRKISGLEVLDLGENEIQELPKWIAHLKTVRGINLAGNRLRILPQEIGSLPNLVFLLLQRNQLERLPKTLQRSSIGYLFLSGNQKLGIPNSLVASYDAEQILRYYFESHGNKGTSLLELKLLLVGRGGAGARARPL